MSKTYKHIKTEHRFRKKRKKALTQIDTKRKIYRELEDNENKKELFELQDFNYEKVGGRN
tara:strand:- start:864 stop:1043 length:180 start_codon:yes stop_codon:yes gene_type:complete